MTNPRSFDQGDQDWFASLTGDRNPIHVDPVYARRTLAGAPVVHGIHLLLWALDEIAERFNNSVPSRISVSFDRFLLVGETAIVQIAWHDRQRAALRIEAQGVACCSIDLTFGEMIAEVGHSDPAGETFAPTNDAVERSATDIDGMTGRVSPAQSAEAMARSFPRAANWLGSKAVTAFGATTRLVGMICPGLHSIFKGLDVGLSSTTPSDEGTISFSAGAVRHGLVNVAVLGGGLSGNVSALFRTPPRKQAAMRELVSVLPPDIFTGSTALVAGGSRGLGELTAKLLATGGADVIITWNKGEADADAVAEEIRAAGGRCRAVCYRIGEASHGIASLAAGPTHGYYFAAPTIVKPASSFFDSAQLRSLERFFVDGFWEFAQSLQAMRADVRLFYPSTVYVEHWPKGLAEYAMAKATGEILCAEMNARLAPLTVVSARLPRLPTDQTATFHGTVLADPVATLLPLIHKVQRS